MERLDARRAILEASEKKLRPLQVMRLRLALSIRPFVAQNAIDLVQLNCQAAGMVSEDGEIAEAVSWEQIVKLVELLLPLILKLFGL